MTRRRISRHVLVPLCLALLLGGLALPAAPVSAATQHVTSCADAGTNTLRGRIAAAATGETIVFDQNCTIMLASGSLILPRNVTIDGTGHTVIVDGGCTGCDPGGTPSGGVTVFGMNSNVTVNLSNLTIRHGHNDVGGASLGFGGGIGSAGTLTVTNCTITANRAAYGGGIYSSGTLTVTGGTVSNNSAANDGGGIYSVGGPTVVSNGTISGNKANNDGGGIYGIGTLTVTNGSVTGNSAVGNGGGMDNGGTLTVMNSTFSSNAAALGGGLDTITGSQLTMTNCTVSGNNAVQGGGLQVDGIATVTSSTIGSNSASVEGGGVYDNDTLTLTNSTLSGNSGSNGGGVSNRGFLTVTNSTLRTNSASFDGGGIYNFTNDDTHASNVTVTNSTLSGNTASVYGGGIRNFGLLAVTNSTFAGGNNATQGGALDNGGAATLTNNTISGNSASGSSNIGGGIYAINGTLTITNTIVMGNTSASGNGGDVFGTRPSFTTGGHNMFGTYPEAPAGQDFIRGPGDFVPAAYPPDPPFGTLGNYGGTTQTLPLLPGSSAINAGDDAVCAAAPVGGKDQRGISRSQGGACDIGAFESQGFSLAISGGNNQCAGINLAFANPLAVALTSAHGEPVDGGLVWFVAPSSDASITPNFSIISVGATTTGQARLSATANGTVGGPYTVTASVQSGTAPPSVDFSLTNVAAGLCGIGPDTGPTSGGNKVTLTGVGFGTPGNTQVLVDGTVVPAASLISVTGTKIVYVAPAHAVGNAVVTVKVSGTPLAGSATYTYAVANPLPGPKPPGGTTGSPSPLPVVRQPGTTGGSAPNPLPAPRP